MNYEQDTSPMFITVSELAEHLRISTSSAYELCREEGFPSIRVRGVIRIPTAGLAQWLEDQAGAIQLHRNPLGHEDS